MQCVRWSRTRARRLRTWNGAGAPRPATHGGLLNWEFKRRGKSTNVQVPGRLVFNTTELILAATLAGHGLAWVPADIVCEHIAARRLMSVLDDRAETYPGHHLCYASRSSSPALALVVTAPRETMIGAPAGCAWTRPRTSPASRTSAWCESLVAEGESKPQGEFDPALGVSVPDEVSGPGHIGGILSNFGKAGSRWSQACPRTA